LWLPIIVVVVVVFPEIQNGSKNARFFKTQFGKNLNFAFEKMADFSKFISKSQRTGDESIINSNKQTQGRGT
jgi:hypothetical protein